VVHCPAGRPERIFGLPLWLTTECVGGEVLWALNALHLDYLERFVASTQRDRDFPSLRGAGRIGRRFTPRCGAGVGADSLRDLRQRVPGSEPDPVEERILDEELAAAVVGIAAVAVRARDVLTKRS
jgi:hypothetical protein